MTEERMQYGPRHPYPPGTFLAAHRELGLALWDLWAAVDVRHHWRLFVAVYLGVVSFAAVLTAI